MHQQQQEPHHNELKSHQHLGCQRQVLRGDPGGRLQPQQGTPEGAHTLLAGRGRLDGGLVAQEVEQAARGAAGGVLRLEVQQGGSEDLECRGVAAVDGDLQARVWVRAWVLLVHMEGQAECRLSWQAVMAGSWIWEEGSNASGVLESAAV